MTMYRAVEQNERALEPEYRMPTGLSVEELAQSARTVFLCVVLEGRSPAWSTLKTEQKERWIYIAGLVARTLLSEVEMKWLDLTRACHKLFHGADTWASEPIPVQLAWEAAVRHMANIGWTGADDDGESDDPLTNAEVKQLEQQAKTWVAQRLAKIT